MYFQTHHFWVISIKFSTNFPFGNFNSTPPSEDDNQSPHLFIVYSCMFSFHLLSRSIPKAVVLKDAFLFTTLVSISAGISWAVNIFMILRLIKCWFLLKRYFLIYASSGCFFYSSSTESSNDIIYWVFSQVLC